MKKRALHGQETTSSQSKIGESRSETAPPLESNSSPRLPAPPERPRWTIGFASGAGAFVLIALSVFYFFPPSATQQPVLVLLVSFGMALAFAAVGGEVSVKFKIPFLANNPLAGSAAGGIGAFVLTAVIANWLFKQETVIPASGGPPTPFALRLSLSEGTENAPDIEFHNGTERSENVAFQHLAGYYLVRDVNLPPPSDRYEAQIRPVVQDSELLGKGRTPVAAVDHVTNLCVQRNASTPRSPAEGYGLLACSFSADCAVKPDDPGWVVNCKKATGFEWPALIRTAYADTKSIVGQYWISSSLDTLRRRHADPKDDPPYMDFEVSGVLAPDLGTARIYTVELRVNGVPVFTNGWRADEAPHRVNDDRTFHYAFALQNLGFSGTGDGFEHITLSFKWLDAARNSVGTSNIERTMVAFRDAPRLEQDDGGAKLSWEGAYQPSARLDRFSIFVASTPRLSEAISVKAALDGAARSFGDSELLGVLRPPLTPWRLQNYSTSDYAVLVGARKKNGQISFSFDEASANDLCRDVFAHRSEFGGSVTSTVFRYEWPEPGESKGTDRERYKGCKVL